PYNGNPCTGYPIECRLQTGTCYNSECQQAVALGETCTDDGDPCTEDICNDEAECIHPTADDRTPCTNDNDPCTIDECIDGACTHKDEYNELENTPCTLVPENECAEGRCDYGVCFAWGAPYNGNPCTGYPIECRLQTGTCYNSECQQAVALGETCADDGDPCTNDICNDEAECIHPTADDRTPCASDNDPCTIDECISGACTHKDEYNELENTPCTLVPENECAEGRCDYGVCFAWGTPYNGNPCTGYPIECRLQTGTCYNTECQQAVALGETCADDGNPCTNDICNDEAACIHPTKETGTECGIKTNACGDSCIRYCASPVCGDCELPECAPEFSMPAIILIVTLSILAYVLIKK
ncbi:hypothetical protein KY311_01180, partial [Candidatus Woesearchaeota archaeon]|nr:hypothetical protein [Candidatus Woesearchaeota archaeon]